MANTNDMRCGRPNFQGFGPTMNGPIMSNPFYSAIYEGYLFIPSEQSPFEHRWSRAQPMKLPVSQDDLYNQVVKQRMSGVTATEELCSLRVNNAKRAMIYKFIHERSMSESRYTFELVALKLERDYIQVEEPKSGKTCNRRHDLKYMKSGRQKKRTVSVYVVLQRPVRSFPEGTPTNSLNVPERSLGPYSIDKNSRLLSEFRSGTGAITSRSTPRIEYVPSYARPRDTTRKDNASDAQVINGRVDWKSQHRGRPLIPPPVRLDGKVEHHGPPTSSSTRSFDTTKPTTTNASVDPQHYNGYFPIQDSSRKRVDQNESHRRSFDAWPEHSTLTGSNMDNLPEIKGKQNSLRSDTEKALATGLCPPRVSTPDESQTSVAIVHSFEDGRCEVTTDFRGHMRSSGSSEKLNHLMELDNSTMSSISTSENDSTPVTPSKDDETPLRGSNRADLDGQNLCGQTTSKQKPAWMDNLVPVTLPTATKDCIERVHYDTAENGPNRHISAQAHNSPREAKSGVTVEDEHIKPEIPMGHTLHSDESTANMFQPSSNHIDAGNSPLEASGASSSSVGRIPTGQNTSVKRNLDQSSINPHKNGKVANGDYTSRPPYSSERLASARKLIAEVDQAAGFRAASGCTTNGTHGPHDNDVDMKDLSPSMSKPGSYERLRPQESPRDPSTANARQPSGIRKIFAVKPDTDPKKPSSTHQKSVKFSDPLAPSTPLYTPTSSDVSSSDNPSPYPPPQTKSTPSEPRSTCNYSASRPPLSRRSNHSSTIAPTSENSHDKSSPSHTSTTTTSTTRARTSRQGFNDYDSCSSSSDDNDGTDTRLCQYRKCKRYVGVPFSSRKEMRAHMRTAHPGPPRGG